MNSIRIGDRIWTLDQERGKITSGEDPDALDLSLENPIQNKNIQLLLDRRSSDRLYTDKEGYLHRGSDCSKVEQTREAVFGAVQALQERIARLEGGPKAFANHFFYYLFRDSKINLYEKRVVKQVTTFWDRRKVFVRDSLKQQQFDALLQSQNVNTIKIGAWTRQLVQEAAGETIDLSHADPVLNANIQLLLNHRSSTGIHADEEGYLHLGTDKRHLGRKREAVWAAVQALLERIEGLEEGQAQIAKHYFHNFFRNSKIRLYEKRIVSEEETIWQPRTAFVSDPLEEQLDIRVGNLFWTVSCETGLISNPRSIVYRDDETDCYDLAEGLSEEATHNLQMLLLRKKGIQLFVDEKGLLRKGSGNQEKVKLAVNQALAHAMHRADELKRRAETEIEQPIREDAILFGKAFDLLTRANALMNEVGQPEKWQMIHERIDGVGDAIDLEGLRDMSMRLSNRLDPLVDELEERRSKLLLQRAGALSRLHDLDRRYGELISADDPDRAADLEKVEQERLRVREQIRQIEPQIAQFEQRGPALIREAQDLSVAFSRLSIEARKLQEPRETANETEIKVAEKAQAVLQLPAVSHFLYHFMNREGSIGRLSDQVGYEGSRQKRVFNHDLLEEHVDIVIGDQYWSVNTKTGHISKALPANERHVDVEAINLSSGENGINRNLRELFERTPKTYFRVDDECLLKPVKGLRGRFKYWRNKTVERKKVQEAVSRAIGHLDGVVVDRRDQALKIFLRSKMQGDGPLARMHKEHYNRSAISEKGGLEGLLKHGLQDARDKLEEELELLRQYPLEKLRQPDIEEANRAEIETITLKLIETRDLYEDMVMRATQQLDNAVDAEPQKIRQQLKDSIPQMAELAARRHLRAQALRQGSYEAVIAQPGAPQVEVISVLGYTKRQIIRHRVQDALHELLIQEFFFTQSLGIGLKSIKGGSGGARFAFNRFGKIILVIKPGDEGPYGRNNPRWSAYFKQMFLSIRSCLAENSEPVTEVSSYNVSKGFDFDIVPSTSVRSVESPDFVNRDRKWCSAQAFVSGCKEMGDALELEKTRGDSWRWWAYQNFFKRKTVAESFEDEGHFANHLNRVLDGRGDQFLRAFARFIIHNFLIGDTDCHFGNWFIKEKNVTDSDIINLMAGGAVDLHQLVNTRLMTNDLFYQLHDALLHDEEKFMIIKHDGGSALPRRHPASSFEVRLAYLFEVLPQMKEHFQAELKAQFIDSDRTAYETMATIAIQNLVNVTTASDFHSVWNDKQGRLTFKEWLFSDGVKDEKRLRKELASRLCKNYANKNDRAWRYWHYNTHLIRIKGIVDTLKDRWVALSAHLQEEAQEDPDVQEEEAKAVKDKSMRTLFKVKRAHDFDKFDEGHGTNDNFRRRMRIMSNRFKTWVMAAVPQINRNEGYADLQQMPEILMRDLG